MTGPGAAPIRRRWCSTTRRAAAPSIRRHCWPDYQGILQCDGYAAYKTLAAANEGITLAFCWSHVRREFIELAKGKTAPIATETLQRIAALYAIEAEIRGKPPEIRQAVRQAKSRPLVEALFAWFEEQLARLPGGSPTAKAIRYALNHREGLVRFLDDGRIELDTNIVERAIRPMCLAGRTLFASGDDGGTRWARSPRWSRPAS